VGLPSGKTAEWYYHQLVINQKLTERVKRRRQELFNPCGGVEGSASASDKGILLKTSVEEVISALKTVKDIGNFPKTLCELIIKGRRETFLITYISELENFIHSSLSGRYRWKFNLPSRRFYGEIKPPKVILSSPTVAVVLDVSSSMSHKEISSSLQTIRGLVSSYQGEMVIYVANVDIVKEISVDDDELIPTGGGTSMRQSLISLTQNDDYQAFIVFTDGYTDYPEPHEVNFTPIFWVLTSPNDEFRPPWGKTVTLPNEEA
ncbi:MAG: VWA-like domain-containing protein, partial [Nitrososphaerota archaeon]